MSDPGGMERTAGRVYLQDQVLLAQLTGVKPGESIRELDDIQAQLNCITGSGVAISSHSSHVTPQSTHLNLLSERARSSDVISSQSVVIDRVVPQQLIVEDHNVIIEDHSVSIEEPTRTGDLNVDHTSEDLEHKHVLYQSNESDHRTKDISEHRTVVDCSLHKKPSNVTIESHTDTFEDILDNVDQDENRECPEIHTEKIKQDPILLDREEVLNRLSEAEKFISSCYRDVVLLTMDDPTNRPFLNVFSKYPDKFLYDQSSLRMNVKMSDDMKLFCEVLTNNRELVREASVDNIEVDIKAIMDDMNEARYQTCVGLPSEGQDIIIQKIRKSDIPNLLLEKYNGSLIYRARDCRFVVDCKIGETLHCMQCRIMGVELDEKYSKSRALADFVVPDDAVEEELGGTLVSKRRRGRPKGSKNKLKSEIVDFKEEPEEGRAMFSDLLGLPEDDSIENIDSSEIVRRVDIEAGMMPSGLIGHAIDHEVLLNPIVEVKEDPIMEYHINDGNENSVRTGTVSDSRRGKRKKFMSRRLLSVKSGRAGRKPKIPLPVQCPEEGCNLSFDLIRQYKVHTLEHTNTFPCSQANCIKRFKSKSDLEAHERKHRGEKPYSCTECGKSYATKQDLRLHYRKHTGERPYSCDACGKQFARKAALRIHRVSVHENVKSFLCPECGAAFKANSALIDHRKRVHLQIKPHSCEFCGKEFFSRKDYGEHTRTHTGEKPFQCQLCGKCFGRGYHLKRHVDGVHRGPGLIGPDGQPMPGVLLPVISGEAVYRKPQTIRKIKVVQSGSLGTTRPSTSPLDPPPISSTSLPTSAPLVSSISFTASPTFDLKGLTLATDVKNFIHQQRLDQSQSPLQRIDQSQSQTIEIKAFPAVTVPQDIKPFSGLTDIKPYAPLDLAQRHPSLDLEEPPRATPTSSPQPVTTPASQGSNYAPYVPVTSQHPSHYLAMAHYYRTSQDVDHFVQNTADKFS